MHRTAKRLGMAIAATGLLGCASGERRFPLRETEADRIGLVSRVTDDVALLDSALDTASLIAANSPWGVRMTKEVAWSQLEIGSLQAGIDLENRTQILSSFTADHREALAAFLEKRSPDFQGR